MMIRTLIALAITVLTLASAGSQAQAACQLKRYAVMPVVMEGFRPIVTAKIDGHEIRFIADSGAFFSTMSKASANRLHLYLRDPPFGLKVSGFSGSTDVKVTTTHTFELFGYTFPSMDFVVGADNILSTERDVVGLLGDNILTGSDVEFDLANGAIRLINADDCAHAQLAYWAKDPNTVAEVRLDSSEPFHLIGDAKVNGKRMRVLFDTGTPLSFLSLHAAARVGLTPQSPGVVPAGAARGIGDRNFATWIIPVTELDIGGEAIKNTRLRVADAEMDDEDLVLGADFFL
jgi:predicted aspartyl protease